MGNKTTLTLLSCLALGAGAQADIVIQQGGALVTFENTQFNTPGLILSGPVVEGAGSVTGSIIEFFGAGEDLNAIAAGAARVTGLDGNFTALSVQMQDPLMAFEELEFNLIGTGTNGTVTITAYSNKGGTTVANFNINGSGNNRYSVLSTMPDYISLIEIASTVNVQDIRQFRFNGAQIVPEPASLVALGVGTLLLAARRRKRI